MFGFQYFACTPNFKDELVNKSFKGVIIKKYESTGGCRGEFLIVDEQKIQRIKTVCYCVNEQQNVWDYATVGDTLLKREGELQIYVIRKTETRKYEYPNCIQ